MNVITTLGGVVGILVGVAVIGVVIAVGVLPLVFINRHELRSDPDEDQRRETTDRMSVHI